MKKFHNSLIFSKICPASRSSYLRDTKDFLSKLHALEKFPVDAIIASVDVVNLYPSTPHQDGLSALSKFLVQQGMPKPEVSDVYALAQFLLTGNYFTFDSDRFLQISGTAIGTRMAPTYAIIFMHILETQMLKEVPYRPFIWLRFIDDIFMVWCHGENKLIDFFAVSQHCSS